MVKYERLQPYLTGPLPTFETGSNYYNKTMTNNKEFRSFTAKLSHEMTQVQDNKCGDKIRRSKILDTGWTRIPNCQQFNIELKGANPHWKSLGIDVNNPPKIEIISYMNKPMNRYMVYQVKRLKILRDQKKYEMYWRIAFNILKRSSSFRCSAIQHVVTNWYKTTPLWQIMQHNRKVQNILESMDCKLIHKRVYIPKKDTFRPLGVPSMEWRIVLHMVNNLCHMFFQPQILASQHGFIPGRGTMTAWKDIFTRAVHKNFLFETDLKQFFPSVNTYRVSSAMESWGMPEWVSSWLYNININTPEFPSEIKVEEKYFDPEPQPKNKMEQQYEILARLRSRRTTEGAGDKWDKIVTGLSGLVKVPPSSGDPLLNLLKRLDTFPKKTYIGLPQGAPTSPFLSMLVLIKEFLVQQDSISYADDPLFFSDEDFGIKQFREDGIELHDEKSHWVKLDGVWQSELKYLGMKYDPFKDVLSGHTRNGSRLELTSELRDKILSQFSPKSPKTWVSLFSTKYIGMLFSRLYIGSWELGKIEQDFSLHYEPRSMTEKILFQVKDWRKHITVFNISSLACQELAKKVRFQISSARVKTTDRPGFKRLHIKTAPVRIPRTEHV